MSSQTQIKPELCINFSAPIQIPPRIIPLIPNRMRNRGPLIRFLYPFPLYRPKLIRPPHVPFRPESDQEQFRPSLRSRLYNRYTRRARLRIEAGGVVINDIPTYRIDHMPYGGIKDSGLGREGLRYAIEEMTEPRLMVVNRLASQAVKD